MPNTVIAGLDFDGLDPRVISTQSDKKNGLTRVKTNMGVLVFAGSQPLDAQGFTTGALHRVVNSDIKEGPDKYIFFASGVNIPMTYFADETSGTGIGIFDSKGDIKVNSKNKRANVVSITNSPNTKVIDKDTSDKVIVRTIGYY